jgi:hypothetical protein
MPWKIMLLLSDVSLLSEMILWLWKCFSSLVYPYLILVCRLCAAVWRFTCVHLWIFGCTFSSNCFSCLQVLHHSPLSCCAKL